MPKSAVLHPDGTWDTVTWAHEEVSTRLGGDVTFVGAVPELYVFALSLREHTQCNPFCVDADIFMQHPINGPVVFVATDADGAPMDVDVGELVTRLRRTP